MKPIISLLLMFGLAVSLSGCDLYPPYKIYSQRIDGEAELAQAQYSKQVQVQDAEGKLASAKLLAQAAVEQAKGIAAANKIIQDGLGGPSGYLAYLQIEALKDTQNRVVYVPTEANLPITEASRKSQ